MFSVLVFFLVLILISILGIKYKIPPYFNLVGGALVFGILMGTDPNTLIDQITKGTTSIFYSLGIPILAGSVIAKCLATQGYIEQIISDHRRFIKSPSILSAFSGFFLGVPSTCPITAFMILSPVNSQLLRIKKGNISSYILLQLGVQSVLHMSIRHR